MINVISLTGRGITDEMPQGRSVKGFLDEVNCGEKTHWNVGCSIPWIVVIVNEQEKAN